MLLSVGRIIRPHGVHGELVVEIRTDEPDSRFAAGRVYTTDPAAAGPLTATAIRGHQGRLLITFDEVEGRTRADELRGVFLCVDSDTIDAPDDPDEFRDHDLWGLDVVTVDGERVGEITRIEHGPAHDMLVVKRAGRTPAYIPFIKAMVPEVDVPGRRVVVDPPEGLLDL
ncbi:ribosome maturation factor RimM [Actinorhabdospora filicis]|uniref:Ribosome maturation factor RimM n=1 Tax=Actinorhabdospora filicis TaxID=1785913 RepID=A0A9W6SHQ4_9ACTN|nr:ribosome maturation factor RimM [Actinorhabdospora filicis]